MPVSVLAALAAVVSGVVSGGLVLSVATQSLLRVLLLGLAPLPLFASGLSAGKLACLATGLTGAVIVTLGLTPAWGGAYLAAAALPATILVWQALRARPTPEGTLWYPGGDLLLWLAGIGIAGVIGTVSYCALFEGGLVQAIRHGLDYAVERGVMPQGLAQPAVAAAMLARVVPGLVVALWIGILVVDAAAAEWLLVQIGLAVRPPIDIGRLRLPLWIGPVFLVAGLAGAILRQGTTGIVCLNSAIVLIVPFAFLGLATIHMIGRGRRGGTVLIAAAYLLLLGSPALVGWEALLMMVILLAGLGTVDQLLDLRGVRGLRDGLRK
jgi:hypothetical protein